MVIQMLHLGNGYVTGFDGTVKQGENQSEIGRANSDRPPRSARDKGDTD